MWTQFYLSEADVGKARSCCAPRLQELNQCALSRPPRLRVLEGITHVTIIWLALPTNLSQPLCIAALLARCTDRYVAVREYDGELTDEFIAQFQVSRDTSHTHTHTHTRT